MNKYTIKETNIKHKKDEILSVLKKNIETSSIQKYEWNYENSPYGNAKCWTAKNEETNIIVGTASLFPRKILIKNKPFYTAIAGDFAVDKKHRAFGPALKLIKEVRSNLKNTHFKFIYGVPNKLSKTLFLRIGYKEIGKYERYIKILKTEHLPKEILKQSLHSKIRFKIIKYLLKYKTIQKIADYYIKTTSKEKHYKKNTKHTIEILDAYDERFDLLWKKTSKQYNIIGERNARFLNWRYKQSPIQDYKTFCIIEDKKEITGYITYFIEDKICHVVDILYIRSENILDSLLSEFTLHIREKNNIGAIVIRYLGNKSFDKKLKEYNFHTTEEEDINVTIYSPDFSKDKYILNKQNWHFFTGDTDG